MFGRKQTPEHVAKALEGRRRSWGDRPSPLKGRPISKKHRDNITMFMRNNGAYWSGRSHAPETVEKMRAIVREGMKDPERREHLRRINTGKTVPEEVRKKISASLKGKPKPPRSEEHRINLTEANRRNGERIRARNAAIIKPSKAMVGVLRSIDAHGRQSIGELSSRTGFSVASVTEALSKMVDLGWMTVSKEDVLMACGRGMGLRPQRFFGITPAGCAQVAELK